MTLDVEIGKVVIRKSEDTGRAYIGIDECPDAEFDVSPETFTYTPRSAYRSGSTGYWEWWMKKSDVVAKIYDEMRDNPNTNDTDVTYLEKYVDRINKLSEDAFDSALDKDRLHWLKYWVNKAVELYGKEAGIKFS